MKSWDDAFESVRDRWYEVRCDLMSVIGRQRKEVAHSAALAWLMDPNAPHGLGTVFIKWFLKTCEVQYSELAASTATVACEVESTYKGKSVRADICIRVGEATVVIEAKIDDSDREKQCNRLVDAFCKRLKPEERPSFVFLTPAGRPPANYSARRGVAEFRLVSFRGITKALEDIVREAGITGDRPAGRTTLDYLATLRAEFGTTATGLDPTTQFYLDNQPMIDEWERARKRHVKARNGQKSKVRLSPEQRTFLGRHEWLLRQWGKLAPRAWPLVTEFYESIRTRLGERALVLPGTPDLWPPKPRPGGYQYLVLHLGAWKNGTRPRVGVGIEWKQSLAGAAFGVVSFENAEGAEEIRDDLHKALAEAFPADKQRPLWPLMRHVSQFNPTWTGRADFAQSLLDSIEELWKTAAPIVSKVLRDHGSAS